ncbi:MAG: hypothetical protein HQK72_10395 [Desulfamplus sp.]|nr:hypothetical protein [Desulfamplus sp.]
MATCVLQIKLPNNILEKIEKLRNKKSVEDTIIDLINYALKMPQYFMEFDWNESEYEADKEISAGLTKSFNNVEDFIAELKQ